MIRFLSIFLVAVGVAHASHLAVDQTQLAQPDDPRETYPSVAALQLMSLGYPSLVADYYWMHSVSQYGDIQEHNNGYPNLEPVMRRALKLDPYFESAYILAGTALTTNDMDKHASVELVEPGITYRPDSWRIAFLAGFNSYYFLGDYKRAATALAQAAARPKAPPFLKGLAARVASEGGAPIVALQMLDTLLPTIEDEVSRDRLMEHRKKLILELHLIEINKALTEFEKRFGHRAPSIEALIQSSLLSSVPAGPLGGRYFIDKDGRSATTSEDKRLRLDKRAQNPKLRWRRK